MQFIDSIRKMLAFLLQANNPPVVVGSNHVSSSLSCYDRDGCFTSTQVHSSTVPHSRRQIARPVSLKIFHHHSNLMTFHFVVTLILTKWALYIFAHSMTAVLSCHVQTLWRPDNQGWDQTEFFIEFQLRLKNQWCKGPGRCFITLGQFLKYLFGRL